MKPRHRGFTLIEMLLALTLTSLLTAALSVMIGQAARERDAMREQTHDPEWGVQLIGLLERDLGQAQWWAGAEERIVMVGLGRDGLPAQIEYRWVGHETGNALVRKQVPLTAGIQGRDQSNASVIGLDLQGFAVGPFGFGEQSNNDDASAPGQRADRNRPILLIEGKMVSLQPLPDTIAVQLLGRDNSKTGLSRELVLR